MKPLVAALAIFLAACATMKNGETRPTEGPCVENYDSAKIGEKETLAGSIMLPIGGALVLIAPFAIVESYAEAFVGYPSSTKAAIAVSGVMIGLGSLGILAGIVTLIDGHRRINKWNNTCTGTTIAERYCLFDENVSFEVSP